MSTLQTWNIQNTGRQNTPPVLGNVNIPGWIRVLLFPFDYLYNVIFSPWMSATRRSVNFNGQTIKLQNLLNDLFDNQLRRIIINNQWYINPAVYIGQSTEPQIVYEGKATETPIVYIGNATEYLGGGTFTVIVPNNFTVISRQKQLKATVEQYRYAGTIPYYQYANGNPF